MVDRDEDVEGVAHADAGTLSTSFAFFVPQDQRFEPRARVKFPEKSLGTSQEFLLGGVGVVDAEVEEVIGAGEESIVLEGVGRDEKIAEEGV